MWEIIFWKRHVDGDALTDSPCGMYGHVPDPNGRPKKGTHLERQFRYVKKGTHLERQIRYLLASTHSNEFYPPPFFFPTPQKLQWNEIWGRGKFQNYCIALLWDVSYKIIFILYTFNALLGLAFCFVILIIYIYIYVPWSFWAWHTMHSNHQRRWRCKDFDNYHTYHKS